MLEDIRAALMERIVVKKAMMESTEDDLCPRIRVKLDKERDEARNCIPRTSRDMVFEVSHRLDQFHVDINAFTCTCRKWDMTGVRCYHAISCADWLNHDVDIYLQAYFKRTLYMKSYERAINRCVGERHWSQ